MTIHRLRPITALSVVAALALYSTLWIGWVHDWQRMDTADSWALGTMNDAAENHTWWIPLWNGLSFVFAPAAFRILVVIPVLLELRRHRYRVAAFLAVSVWGSGIVTAVAKHLADRDRPGTRMVDASETSFPSGHALGVLVAVGALLAVYAHLARGIWKWVAVGTGVVVVLAIGVARVALNVHHPSDVIAGWALGYAWLMLCLWIAPPTGSADRKAEPGASTTPAATGG